MVNPSDASTESKHSLSEASLPGQESESAYVMDLNQIHYHWPGQQQPILSIDSLRVQAGESVFIYGPSGCGKSTLLSLMAGVLVPDQGSIHVAGFELSSASAARRDRFRADHIGFVFQQFNLLPYLSVIDNVTLACRFSKRRQQRLKDRSVTPEQEARRLLARLEIPEALWNAGVNHLSIGQQQRVAVARAMIGSPPVIIADEPTSALDRHHRDQFLTLLTAEACDSGTSLIFVSHDEDLVRHFSRTLFLPEVNQALC